MKKLSALIAVLFASTSIAAFAQATTTTKPAESAKPAASTTATAAPAKADADTCRHDRRHGEEGREESQEVLVEEDEEGKLGEERHRRHDGAGYFTRAIVRTGVSVMPFFRKTEISDAELDALSKYLAHK